VAKLLTNGVVYEEENEGGKHEVVKDVHVTVDNFSFPADM